MNPVLQKLGFGPNDRVAIVHADDIGAYQASLPAVEELFAAGLLSSCATMVPCSWFPAVVDFARRNPTADIGVHATLTSEYGAYRWGPISTRDPASGMLDAEGYFHSRTPEVQAGGDPAAVAAEVRAQVERALAAGIDVTHVDSHMGASFSPAFLPGYLEAARLAGAPPFLLRVDEEQMRARGMPEEIIALLLPMSRQAEESGLPVVDHMAMMPLDRHEERVAEAKAVFDGLPAGLSYVILHPAVGTPEMQALTPDWRARAADHEAFCSRELRDYVRGSGVQVIGWRAIRDVLRAG
jgi:chitin disaccharide deacetylase